jgi:hypothetical protein
MRRRGFAKLHIHLEQPKCVASNLLMSAALWLLYGKG